MPQHNDLLLISAVMEAAVAESLARGISLVGASSRLFALVEQGERDFDTLLRAVLDHPPPENEGDRADSK